MKLDRKNVENIIDLTPTQEGILFHYLYEPNPHHYFEQTCLYIKGELDKEVFNKSWHHVIQQNETLRTSFFWNKIKRPVQIISKSVSFEPCYTDLSELSAKDRETAILKIKNEDKERGFDLQNVPFRITVAMLDQHQFMIVISSHSILYDGWSFNIILKEFFDAYHGISRKEQTLALVKTQFKDYIKLLKSLPAKNEKQYWQEYLASYEFKEIPFKQKNNDKAEQGLAIEVLRIPEHLAIGLESLSKKFRFGVPAFFYAVWGIVLQKICNENDVLFGTTFSGRSINLMGIEGIVGNFLNTLPVRVMAQPGDTIIDLILAISNDIVSKQEYDQTSLSKIRKHADLTKQGDLFDSLVIFENHPIQQAIFDEHALRIEKYTFEHASNYDLTVFILKSLNTYQVHFAYNTNKFKQAAIARIAQFFSNLITESFQSITTPVRLVSIISDEERSKLVDEFNNTSAPYRREISLKELVEDKGNEYAQRVAVISNGQFVTYDELHKRCNRIAWNLRNSFNDKICVGLIVDRSVEMIVSVLSVIKAGFTFVPIDPMLPNSRIKGMVDNLSLQCIITTNSFQSKVEDLVNEIKAIKVLYTLGSKDFRMDREYGQWVEISGNNIGNLPSISNPLDVAYVIFTSGSTGIPKGVAVQHRPVVNIVEWINNSFSINREDKVLCVASLGFDLSVYDIFGALAKGAALCIATFEELASPDLLMKKVIDENITIWNSAPAVLQNLIQWNEMQPHPLTSADLRAVMLSGDWIGLQLPHKIGKYFKRARILSLGGATEATIWSNYYFVGDIDPTWSSIPYGKPIQNCRYYVLDPNLAPCPIDVIGDLYIGGECLALGYVNDIVLTNAKFIGDPFTKNGKMYATGDLARWREDGNMELIGRKDNQVKIRGYRIELGEIESHMLELPGVDQALAIADVKESGEKFICVYYLGSNELDQVEMKRKLAVTLPSYMIPLHIIRIGKLPVTSNGKIDRKKLPKPTLETSSIKIQLPENSIQSHIISIWSEILSIPVKSIGIHSNFFELGGHSLNVTELTSKLANRYNINLQLREVFSASTVDELSHVVAKNLLRANHAIPVAERREYYSLTSGQLRMFALHEMNKSGVTYNIVGGAIIKGALNVPQVQQTFGQLIKMHDSLRTIFKVIEGKACQKIEKTIDFKVEYFDVARGHLTKKIQTLIQPFDLEHGPLVRVSVIKYDDLEYCIIIDMHHIIADGFSLKKLIQEFSVLYEGRETLTNPVLQFKDYATYVNKKGHLDLWSFQHKYWANLFSGEIPRLNLPLDYERQEERDYAGDKVYFSIRDDQFFNLKLLAAEVHTTLFTVVLSMFNVFLAKVCNQEDIIIATPSIGRSHSQIENIIGMFVNTLVVRNFVPENITFLSFLKETKKRVAEALSHEDVPFEYLVRSFDRNHSKSRNPIFDVLFEYDNLNLHSFKLAGMDVTVMNDLVKRAKFDITLEAIEFSDRLDCRFEYRTSLFKRETIQWMAERFLHITSSILLNSDVPLRALNVSNRQHVLAEDAVIDFNF